jgi:hypothetical protein
LPLVLAALLVLGGSLAEAGPKTRTIAGRGVRFDIPAGADKSSFSRGADGRFTYATATRVEGLGKLSVTVGPRGDPEATLKNEMYGVQANARTKHFRKAQVKTVDINRGKGVQALCPGPKGGPTAWIILWTKKRQFELTLESKSSGTNPLGHRVWKSLVSSFRSDEPGLK